jgi:hypothetical protein
VQSCRAAPGCVCGWVKVLAARRRCSICCPDGVWRLASGTYSSIPRLQPRICESWLVGRRATEWQGAGAHQSSQQGQQTGFLGVAATAAGHGLQGMREWLVVIAHPASNSGACVRGTWAEGGCEDAGGGQQVMQAPLGGPHLLRRCGPLAMLAGVYHKRGSGVVYCVKSSSTCCRLRTFVAVVQCAGPAATQSSLGGAGGACMEVQGSQRAAQVIRTTGACLLLHGLSMESAAAGMTGHARGNMLCQ